MAAAAVVPLLAYGAVSILSLRRGAQEAVIQGNLNVARRAAEQINLYVTGSVKILRAVAADLQQQVSGDLTAEPIHTPARQSHEHAEGREQRLQHRDLDPDAQRAHLRQVSAGAHPGRSRARARQAP